MNKYFKKVLEVLKTRKEIKALGFSRNDINGSFQIGVNSHQTGFYRAFSAISAVLEIWSFQSIVVLLLLLVCYSELLSFHQNRIAV